VAESEKYAHVTYFFNGGHEAPFPNEDRIVVPSPKVGSYDQIPEMSEPKITQVVVENLRKYDFIVLNFANADMVGHTGNLRATMQACEAVDRGLTAIFEAVQKIGGVLVVTADHGNAEQKVNPQTGEPDTEHTANPVPFILAGEMFKGQQLTTGSVVADQIPGGVAYDGVQLRQGGKLSDIAPTILQIMNLAPSDEMTGRSLIIPKA
jgi:2,3-bisphosphoglycerate-independent phosphoglycerate mutase